MSSNLEADLGGRNFLIDERGHFAMMFSLLIVPILFVVGVAVDLGYSQMLRARVAEATDAGILAAVRAKSIDADLTDEELEEIANRIFLANLPSGLEVEPVELVPTDTGGYALKSTGSIDTFLLGAVGVNSLNIGATAEARLGGHSNLEIALVLDNTGSMAGQKIADLEAAATSLVDTIMVDGDDRIRVAVVPFSRHVNVGISQSAAPWLFVPSDATDTRTECFIDEPASQALGCYTTTETCTYQDGVEAPCTVWHCPSGVTTVTNCNTTTLDSIWQGCVGSREYPLNIQDADFATVTVPGVRNWVMPGGSGLSCPSEIVPLTSSKSTVTTALSSMSTVEETYIPIGLTWGHRVLSAGAPYTEGKTYAQMSNDLGIKALVLMTDGQNTASPDPFMLEGRMADWHYGTDPSVSDDYTLELCTEIKSNDIRLYTISFGVTDSATKTMLENCATQNSYYYDAMNAAQLTNAFDSVAQSLVELSLVK